MSDAPNPTNPQPPGDFSQSVERPQVAAVVPESVARGVFATAPLVFTGQHELVVDFMQSLSRPNTVAARVVMAPAVAAQLVAALQQNLELYRNRFGGPVEPPPPANPAQQPDVKEIYERHKLSDSVLSGVYANAVLITHTYSEFCFDFITTFFPKAAVAARIFMSAPVVPAFGRTLHRSVEQYKAKMLELQQQMLRQQPSAAPGGVSPGTPPAPPMNEPPRSPTDPKPPFDPPHFA